jgi:pimeloyl-ACP methyl ester carboxylesterase
MNTLHSADGTAIAYSTAGHGPAVILVDGALCHRGMGPSGPLAKLLAEHFSVYTYDRRGRGDSGDTAPYDVDREVDDLAALIEAAGGSAHVYGISSGAVLALEATARGLAVDSLALYEPPFIVDASRTPMGARYTEPLAAAVADDRRGDAVKLFMREVGVPAPMVAVMRLTPAWRKLTAVAHTLPYDAAVMGDTQSGNPLPAERWADVTTPTLVAVGGKSPAWLQSGGYAVADVLPEARRRTLEGQTHMVKAKVLAPVLADFFAGADRVPVS